MEKDKMDVTRRFFSLTLEIIYLLTGEDFTVVRESGELISRRMNCTVSHGSNDSQGATVGLKPLVPTGEIKNDNILKLTSKIIHLLTGEVRRFVGRVDGSNEDIIEDSQFSPPLDGSSNRNPPGRCPRPLYSRDSSEEDKEDHSMEQDDDHDDNVISIKVEDEEDPYMRGSEKKSPLEISTDGSSNGNTPERHPRPLHSRDSTPCGYQAENPELVIVPHAEDGDDDMKGNRTSEVIPGLCRAGDAEMEDRKPLLDEIRSRAKRSPSPHLSFTPHCLQSIKQEVEDSPHSCAEDDYRDRCEDTGYYNAAQQYFKEEEEEEQEEYGTHQEDQLDEDGHEVATQTEQADEMQIKEEQEPVDIDYGYDMNDQDSCDSATTSRAGCLPIDEYGQLADKPKQYICSECGKGFSLYSYLTKHQRCHSDEKPFTCIECGKCFRYKPSLVAHQRVHTGEKPFSCTECGKLFVTKFNLKAHAKVHTGEKPVECPACGRCFSNNPALVKHLRIHTGEKPFSCTVCGKVFASRSCLNAHQVIHTGERPYMCAECGKAFANQSNLISHRIIHTGQKPYICPECGRGFANQSNLAKHKMTHTDHKPFVCIECGNVFARKEGLAKHFERIHKKKLEF
ncbi:uncharacterized protein [Aquarana catesbeiana]|uniref:uncharacterized protein isoform X1 n=1 Tax=Aquarana catesbeiana TaxID=8400 RepID=UPI003CC9B72D